MRRHHAATPPDRADRMVELADVRDGHWVLDPGAGTGALLDAARRAAPGCHTVGVEQDSQWIDELRAGGHLGIWWNFEYFTSGFRFDRILISIGQAWIVETCSRMLLPGGRLVAWLEGPNSHQVRWTRVVERVPLNPDRTRIAVLGIIE